MVLYVGKYDIRPEKASEYVLVISASLNFGSIGSRGGNAGGCFSLGGVPNSAHINMIAVNPTGKGNLQAFPVGAGTGVGLSVNYNTKVRNQRFWVFRQFRYKS